jgi:D-arabinose 1-dehydrogenase-like Zn-dependent alcohol dehydrogenase
VWFTPLELSKIIDVKVILVALSKEKLELSKQFGAKEIINYT